MDSVCVSDFCGSATYHGVRVYPVQMWADFYPAAGVTRFGGCWAHVPDMPSCTEPTESDVEAWAARHGGWEPGYARALACE